MKRSISLIAVSVMLATGMAHANVGMLTQDPNAPSTNYDDIQDHAYQAAASLANSALNQNQQIVTQVNTVSAAVGANAQAIGVTNAALGQTNQTVQQNWNQQNQNNQVLAQQINKNAAQINGLTQQAGNFVTKPDFDKSLKAQDLKNKSFINKNNTQDGLITGLRTDVDTNKAGVAANTAAIATKVSDADFKADQARQDGLIAKKADQTGLDTANQDIADNAAEIAASKTNITKINDGLTQEIADRKAGDAKLQTSVDANSKLIATKADSSQVNALAVSTHAEDVRLQGEIDTKADKADLTKEQQNRLAADQQLATRINDKVDQTTYDAGQAAQDKSLNDETTARTDADKQHTTDIAANKAAIAGKVSQADFDKDQQRQDTALTNGLASKVDQTAFNSHVSSQQARDAGQDKMITDETDARHADVKMLNNHIDGVEQTLTNDINTVDTESQKRDTKLASDISKKVDTTTFVADQKRQDNAMEVKYQDTLVRINDAKVVQDKVNKSVASTLDNHETRITSLENKANKQFSDLKSQIDKNEKKANAGTSVALAAAGIPQVMADQQFSVGAATGGYEGESAVAVGFSARVSHNVVVKASVGTDTQSGVGYNAGVAIGW